MYSITWIDTTGALFSVATPSAYTAWQLYRRLPRARVWRTKQKNKPQLIT